MQGQTFWRIVQFDCRESRFFSEFPCSEDFLYNNNVLNYVPQEFKPEVLTTRSRAETATVKRRLEMEKEMEKHERERIQTARPGDLFEGQQLPPSPATRFDFNMVKIKKCKS